MRKSCRFSLSAVFALLQYNPVAAVAQLDRVLGYEPRGRGFDSCQPHQKRLASELKSSEDFSFMAAVIVNGFRFIGLDFVYQLGERAAFAQLAVAGALRDG